MRKAKSKQKNAGQKPKSIDRKKFPSALVMDGMGCLPTNPLFEVRIAKSTAPAAGVSKKNILRIVRDFDARKDEPLSTAITYAIGELSVSPQDASELFVVFSPDIHGGYEIVLANTGFEGHEDIATTFNFNAISFDAKQFAKHLAAAKDSQPRIADRRWFNKKDHYCLLGASQPGLDDALEVWTASSPEKAMIYAAAASPEKRFQFLGTMGTVERAAQLHAQLLADPGSQLLRDLRTGGSSCR